MYFRDSLDSLNGLGITGNNWFRRFNVTHILYIKSTRISFFISPTGCFTFWQLSKFSIQSINLTIFFNRAKNPIHRNLNPNLVKLDQIWIIITLYRLIKKQISFGVKSIGTGVLIVQILFYLMIFDKFCIANPNSVGFHIAPWVCNIISQRKNMCTDVNLSPKTTILN